MITVLARSCPKECGGSVQTGSTGLSSHNTDWTGGRLPMSFLLSVTRHALPSGHPQLPLPSCAWPGAERGQGELRGGSLVRRRPEDRRIPQREQIFFQAPLRRDRGRSRGTSRGRRAAQPRSACRRLCTHLPPTGPAGAAAHTPRPRPPPPHPDAASGLPSPEIRPRGETQVDLTAATLPGRLLRGSFSRCCTETGDRALAIVFILVSPMPSCECGQLLCGVRRAACLAKWKRVLACFCGGDRS